MHAFNLFRSLFNRVYRAPIAEGEDGGAPETTPAPQPTPGLSGRNAAMEQIIANANAVVAPGTVSVSAATRTTADAMSFRTDSSLFPPTPACRPRAYLRYTRAARP